MTDYPKATQDTVDLVWAVMQRDHTGYENRISRQKLAIKLFGKCNDSIERKIRDAFSQKAVISYRGYFVPTLADRDKAEAYKNGNRSRIRNLGKKNWIVERFLREQAEPVKAEQLELEV